MQNGADATTAVEFKNVDILFPKAGERVRAPSRDPSIKKALALLDGGADRARIATETGVVLGSAGANLTVKKGEISVLMGLSGSGKSTLLRAANGLNAVTRGEVLVRHGDSFVDVASCNAETLREMRLLLLEEGHCFRDQALSFCRLHAAPPREMLDASSLSTLVQMVGAGIGVTLIPEMAVAVETRSANVSIARFESETPSRRLGMIWRKTNPLASQLLEIAGIVRGAAETRRAQEPGETRSGRALA